MRLSRIALAVLVAAAGLVCPASALGDEEGWAALYVGPPPPVVVCPFRSNLTCQGRSATLTRASSAWYVDDEGNAQAVASGAGRFSSSDGILVEAAATNRLLNSLALTSWTCSATTSAGADSGPWADVAGGAEAFLFNDDDAGVSESCGQTYTSPADTSHTFSTYVRPGTATAHRLQAQCSGGTGANHLATFQGLGTPATATCSVGTGTSCEVLCADRKRCNAGDASLFSGDYLLLVYTVPSCGAGAASVAIRHVGGAVAGDTGTMYLSSSQFEAGTWDTAHVVSGGTATQRSAEVLSVSTVGWPTREGAVEILYTPRWSTGVSITAYLLDSRTGTNGVLLYASGTTLAFRTGDAGGSTTITSGAITWVEGQTYRIRAEWRGGNLWLWRDGVLVASQVDGLAKMPTAHAAAAGIGQTSAGAGQTSAWISGPVVSR